MSRFNLFSLRRNRNTPPHGPPDYSPDLTPPPSYASTFGSTPTAAQLAGTGIWSAMPSAHHVPSPSTPMFDSKRDITSASAQPIALPLDILLRISTFIPMHDLKNMLTVSPAFFDLAMDARYRRISFYDLGNVKVMRRLERLRDPMVAKRVRNLHVRLFLNPNFVRLWGKNKSEKSPWSCPEQEVMSFTTDLVAKLSNVTEFAIGFCDKTVDSYLPVFFATAWSTFGSSLNILSLEGGIDLSKIPIPPRPRPALREMRLLIPGSMTSSDATNDAAAFMNSFRDTLGTLCISSWGSWDLTPFCGQLGPLHSLEQLRISMPFNETMADPEGLTHLLSCHAFTLRHVQLRLDPSGEEREGNLGRWMSANVQDETLLRNLHSLEVALGPLADFPTLIKFVDRSAETLTKLSIRNRFCSYEEVTEIIRTFKYRPPDSRLHSLTLSVKFFEPRLLDLLSEELPHLHELNVNAFNWGEEHWEAHERESSFRCRMEERVYRDWNLYDIGVWLRLGYDEMIMKKVEYDDMLLLAGSIPSVQKFWGRYIVTTSRDLEPYSPDCEDMSG